MRLAKPRLDVGLYTNRYEELRAFYVDRLGLPYEALLKAGRGVHQHRVGLHGSVLKLNDAREPLDDAPSNLVRLGIRADAGVEQPITDPDGTEVLLSPGIDAIGISQRASITGPLSRH